MWNLLLPALAIGGGLFLASNANTQAANTVNAAVSAAQSQDNAIAQSGGVGPGSTYLRSLIMSPGTLTPAQQSQLADLRRSVANQIHGSDFAGSGRTAAALFKKTEGDFVNTALDSNKQQAIGAADKLAGTSDAAATAAAQAGLTGATDIANADIAQGKLYGAALGDVTSLINRQNKANTTGGYSTSLSTLS